MKNLTETEILKQLHAERTELKVSYEEVIHPNYALWGRARKLFYHQGVCLLAGLTPVIKPYFNALLSNQSLMEQINLFVYYPTDVTDRNRLQNIDQLLQSFPPAAEAKKNNSTISPQELLTFCKTHSELAPILPIELISVVDTLGPHPSLNLPSTFCDLEINPRALDTLKKIKRNKTSPIALNVVAPEPTTAPSLPPTPTEHPLAIATRLFPLKDVEMWSKTDALSLQESILLHYNIQPERLYEQPVPGTPTDPTIQEFTEYLNRYFHGDRDFFINQLDKYRIRELIIRAVDAKCLRLSITLTFATSDIVQWMESKGLSFPIQTGVDWIPVEDSDFTPDITALSKEDLLNYNLHRFKPVQLAKLIVRCVATLLWKQSRSLTLPKLRIHALFKETLTLIRKAIKKEEEFEGDTVDDWIRDLNPAYKPKN